MFWNRKKPKARPSGAMSPIEMYVAGGGDMSTASPRLQAILMSAEESHNRQRSRPVEPPAPDRRHQDWKVQHVVDKSARDSFVADHCRPATPGDYAAWLAGYLKSGGRVAKEHDFDMPRGEWYVLTSRPRGAVPSLYGALLLLVIVPESVNFAPSNLPRTFHGACGHSTFYFMKDFQEVGGWVPLYRDVAEILRRPEGAQ